MAEGTVLRLSITGCARCHGDGHADLEFAPLTHPVEHDGAIIGTHFALCPETGEPILMRFCFEPQVGSVPG